MIDLKNAKVTHIQFFDCTQQIQASEDGDHEERIAYSANVIIDDCFVVQLSGIDDEAHRPSIPESYECYWNDEDKQDWASDNIDIDEVIDLLERLEIENNYHYLKENGEAI